MTPTASIDQTMTEIFELYGLNPSQLAMDEESHAYQACTFLLNKTKVIYRLAKVTPNKIGQFVTLWKRSKDGPTQPYDSSDSFGLVIIRTEKRSNSGQFVFPKQILIEKGIITHLKREGKRGFRLYPPWDKPTIKQAKKTQNWQLEFFLDSDSSRLGIAPAKSIYLQ